MESVGLFAGGRLCVSSSTILGSSTQRTCIISNTTSLTYAPCKNNRNLRTSQLSAFHSSSHLFSCSPSRPHHAKTRKPTRTHIFLPHLVASMVCSFSLCIFLTELLAARTQLSRAIYCIFLL